jgi:RNA polymerase sigma-70 factor (ECF subfamily)
MAFDVDRALLLKAAAGDPEAFRCVAETLKDELFNLAWRMTYSRQDAEDLSQEAFITLFRNLHRYDANLPFAPWFRRVFTNVALNYRRRLRPVKTLPEDAADPRPAPGPSDDAEIVEGALKTLPPEYRLVVTFKYFQGLEVEEIARTMKVPEGTVKTWLFRARDLLKQKLERIFRVGV